MHVAGDGSRKPAALTGLRVSCNLPELPAVIERQYCIPRWFQLRLSHSASHARCQYCAAYHSTTASCGSHPESSMPSVKPIYRHGKATDEIDH
jgi:hypothetical protein